MMTPGERARLRAHLIESGIAGDTRTTRENSVRNARLLAEGDPDKQLGIEHASLDLEEVMGAVAALCNCSADPLTHDGPGVIDPERTLDELEKYASRLRLAVQRSERLLICTGHPTGPLAVYMAVARALEHAGCKVMRPLDGERLLHGAQSKQHRGNRVRFLQGVGVLADGASLYHTHDSWPMERLLDADHPELVLADHGFAGAAVARGIETLAFNDVNDPSIAVAKARGMIDVVVPIDDNVPRSEAYEPIGEFLVAEIRAAAR